MKKLFSVLASKMSLSPREWYDHVTAEGNHFVTTLSDIRSLPQGQEMRFYCLDRNVFDTIYNFKSNLERNRENLEKDFDIQTVLRSGYKIVIKKSGEIEGWLAFPSRRGEDPWKICEDSRQKPFQFEVFAEKDGIGMWFPLKNGKVYFYEDERNIFLEEYTALEDDFSGKSINTLPGETRIGWRGPMICERNIGNLPKINFRE